MVRAVRPDRFLFGEYFANREKPLMTLGSSAGAWRLSCLGTAAPLRAIDELAARYSRETYSAQPTVEEITEKMHSMLSAALGSSGAAEIAANLLIQTHIVADRCKGLAGSNPPACRNCPWREVRSPTCSADACFHGSSSERSLPTCEQADRIRVRFVH